MIKSTIDGTEVYEVTEDIIHDILENQKGPDKYGEPYALLWYYHEESGKYVGCDNVYCHAWMEDFDTKEECIEWLLGYDKEEEE